MSLFFTEPVSQSRYAARSQQLSSFSIGEAMSPAKSNTLTSSSSSNTNLRKSNMGFNPKDYMHEAPEKKRSELMSSSSMDATLKQIPQENTNRGGRFGYTPRTGGNPILSGIAEGNTSTAVPVSARNQHHQGRNPILDGDDKPEPHTGRRAVPSYFDRPEPVVHKRGGRKEADPTAAGRTSQQEKEGFVPGLRIVQGVKKESEEVQRTSHKRFCEASHLLNTEAGNPILQDTARFAEDSAASSRAGIRVFPGLKNAENGAMSSPRHDAATEKAGHGILEMQHLRRIADPHASANPILGDVRPSTAHAGLKHQTSENQHKGNDDVIAYKFASSKLMRDDVNAKNYKVGDSQRNMTPDQRLQFLLKETLDTKKTYMLNRAKTTDSSDTLKNFIYDNPNAKP